MSWHLKCRGTGIPCASTIYRSDWIEYTIKHLINMLLCGPFSLLALHLGPPWFSRAPLCTSPDCCNPSEKLQPIILECLHSLSWRFIWNTWAEDACPPSCLHRCQPQGTLKSEPRTWSDLLPATSPCTLSPWGLEVFNKQNGSDSLFKKQTIILTQVIC